MNIKKDSKNYAIFFIKSLIKSTNILRDQPFLGRVVPELRDINIRELLYKGYRIVYKVSDKKLVEILVVYYGTMNLKSDDF